jgi:hypothetical protein
MRESSPNSFSTADPRTASQSECKSLFQNILAVSPCGSIFCAGSSIPLPHKFLRMNILGNRRKKNIARGLAYPGEKPGDRRRNPGTDGTFLGTTRVYFGSLKLTVTWV